MSLIRAWPGHALGDPLFTAAQLAPSLPGPLQRQSRIGDLPHPFVSHPGEPKLDRLRLGTGNGLNQPQQSLGGSHIGEIVFAVGGWQLQLVTICHQLASLLMQPLFELVPVFPGNGGIRLLGEDADNVDDREPPCLRGFVVDAAYRLILEQGGMGGDGHGQRLLSKA